MTAADFQHVVFRLSNTCFVRHWMNWQDRTEPPYLMAFCLMDYQGKPVLPYLGDLARYGPHTTATDNGLNYFIFQRTEP